MFALQTVAGMAAIDLAAFGPGHSEIGEMRRQHAEWQQKNADLEAKREQYIGEQIDEFTKTHEHFEGVEDEIIDQIEVMKRSNPSRVLANPIAALNLAYEKALKLRGIETKQSREAAQKKADSQAYQFNQGAKQKRISPASISSDMWSNDAWNSAYDRIQSRG